MIEVKNNKDCPYIGTIKRHLLDFDLEKVCFISLSTHNVYCCLICGKYYQGRGKQTYAYSHSLLEDHHLFVNLKTNEIHCLPDDYEVIDNSLNDIKANLKPAYTQEDIKTLNSLNTFSLSISGAEYLPGCIGLNSIKKSDHINVILQSLCRLPKFRNFFLTYNNNFNPNQAVDIFIQKLSELYKKMFNKLNFKDHLSPYELIHSYESIVKTQMKINKEKDAIQFLSWILNCVKSYLHFNQKSNINIITQYFTGKLQIDTYTMIKDYSEINNIKMRLVKIDGIEYLHETRVQEFLYLSLNLPATPLFKDSSEKINIPQISIDELMKKFNGVKYTEDPVKSQKIKYKLLSLPKYLILIFNRFGSNRFFTEKNSTIVNFQLNDFKVNDYSYELKANVIHDGKPNQGSFRAQVYHEGRKEWFEIQDLNVEKLLCQSVMVSESYIHFYEMKKGNSRKKIK